MSTETPQKPSKGYGKHSIRYWVVLYLVIAVIVYGLVYLLFFHKSGRNSGSFSY